MNIEYLISLLLSVIRSKYIAPKINKRSLNIFLCPCLHSGFDTFNIWISSSLSIGDTFVSETFGDGKGLKFGTEELVFDIF